MVLGLDILLEGKLRTLSKQKRRQKRAQFEKKISLNFADELTKLNNERSTKKLTKEITELIQTIKAVQIIGGDVKNLKEKLKFLFNLKYSS